jgi:DNA-directed RNA polymerase beta subunit
VSSVRHEACRTLRSKKHEYLKDKMNELEANSKNKTVLYRGREGEKLMKHVLILLFPDIMYRNIIK